ncbi:hypothetical protein [Actinokineospora inagensis]|uniref:hypothetical protein n=1 Tax=Actinokineospora inagensis TaxID=103730 RepID=UPI000417CB34|nr:hypothetical protein [Actinokineospora inagensis]
MANITFDENQFDQLATMLDQLEDMVLHHSTNSDTNPLNADFTLLPGTPKWQAAQDMLSKGKHFGGSVQQQNDALRQAIVKFRNALFAAKGVFNETNDLAQYDVNRFVAEFPDLNPSAH